MKKSSYLASLSSRELLREIDALTASLSGEQISLDEALEVIRAGVEKAEDIGQPMCISVCDASGVEVAAVRMDGAWVGSVDIAKKKAFTSAAFKITTKDLAENAQPGEEFYGIQHSNDGKVMVFAGGVPIALEDGEVIGAVGVSGGSGDQDHKVAVAASDAFSERE